MFVGEDVVPRVTAAMHIDREQGTGVRQFDRKVGHADAVAQGKARERRPGEPPGLAVRGQAVARNERSRGLGARGGDIS